MAKIKIIQDEIGKIDSQLTKIKQAIRNYQNSSIFYLGRETELRANWPHVTQIRKIDRMIRNLKKYEFERANDIEKQIIEQHSKTLMDLLIELIIKYHQVCRNYQEVKERLEDKLINRIGFENPAFEFDPNSQMEIKNGCRLLYNLCERDTYEDIKKQAEDIKNLEESIAELLKLYEMSYMLLNGQSDLLDEIEENVHRGQIDAIRAEKKLVKAVKMKKTVPFCGWFISKNIFTCILVLLFILLMTSVLLSILSFISHL